MAARKCSGPFFNQDLSSVLRPKAELLHDCGEEQLVVRVLEEKTGTTTELKGPRGRWDESLKDFKQGALAGSVGAD
jgi:hypothetical protein